MGGEFFDCYGFNPTSAYLHLAVGVIVIIVLLYSFVREWKKRTRMQRGLFFVMSVVFYISVQFVLFIFFPTIICG